MIVLSFRNEIITLWKTRGMERVRGLIRSLKAVADLLLPRTCIACERALLLEEEHLCSDCLSDLPLTRFHMLRHNPMADRFNAIIQEHLETIWTAGSTAHERYAYATALFFYDGESSYSHITHRLKYDGQLSVGRYFGRMLGEEIRRTPWLQDIDAIIPIPLHWRRRWKRGYNQAEIIAEAISSVTGVPLCRNILERRKYTKTQTLLDVSSKADNVRGAFSARPVNKCNIRHILLVDDVFTTGSTAGECFRALRTVFPPDVRISVATLGFVGRA